MHQTGAKLNAMDITLSIGFLSGIVGQESSKNLSRGRMYDSSGGYNQDGVIAMVTVLVAGKDLSGFDNIVSAPIEATEEEERSRFFTAVFPLMGGQVSSSITIPGLLQEVQTSGRNMSYDQRCFKPQAIDLLISLVYQNEQLYFGKTTILATAENSRTKQVDLPIDTARDSIMRAQKKSTGGKRLPSMKADRDGDIAATAFKCDRSRRKYKIEKDALLRVFIKSKPSKTSHSQQNRSNSRGSYAQQPMATRGMRDYTPMDSSSASRRSGSQSRNPPSSSRQQTGSRRSRSGYSENDIQRTSRSSSRSRSHGGIPLTIEPQITPGYRSNLIASQRNVPPLTQRNHASSYRGGGVYPESVAPNSVYGTRSDQSARPRGIPQRARSVPRPRTRTPENFHVYQSPRNQNQYTTSDSQSIYGGGSRYGGQRYGDNSTISSYRHDNKHRVQNYQPSQSGSRNSVRSRSQSHVQSRPRPHPGSLRY